MSSREARCLVTVALGSLLVLMECKQSSRRDAVALRSGDADRGKAAILRYGCDACHAISGLPDPSVAVAAPVTGIANRRFIAGTLANTPDNLIMWIRFPHAVKPETAMPDLGVSAGDARDIASYLYSLH
jgi:cytochrome c2